MMKKTSLFVWLCLLCCIGMHDMSANSNAGTCRLIDGTIVTTWLTQDPDGPWQVWAATGSIGADPSTWITQEVTVSGATCISITTPTLFINETSGHAVSTWQYFDQSANVQRIAAAVLPAGTTTWVSQAVSDITSESSNGSDQTVSLDNDGNIMVTWSAFNASVQTSVVRAATGTISGTTTTWNNSFLLPGAGYPDLAAKTAAATNAAKATVQPTTQPTAEDVRMPTKIRNN